MNKFDLGDILEKSHRIEFAEYDNPLRHSFSLGHRIKMRKILSTDSGRISIKTKPRLVFVMLVILFLAVITAAVLIIRMNGFFGRVYSDNTQMFAFDMEGCPDSIKDIYQITELPKGYEFSHQMGLTGDEFVMTIFKSTRDDNTLVLTQITKSSFAKNYDNENYHIEQITINESYGFIFVPLNSADCTFMVWENEDYVFEISSRESLIVLIHVAESIKK